MTYQMTSMLIGVLLATTILWLVRRDHLHGPYAIWWIGTAAVVVVLGLFPGIIDYLARYLGVSYPPILAVLLGFALLLIKILTMDLERSRQERRIRRLAQRLALIEGRLPPEDVAIVSDTGAGAHQRASADRCSTPEPSTGQLSAGDAPIHEADRSSTTPAEPRPVRKASQS
ncbi:DUF2304 domain-containing protein [Caldichromatium japonicum]|uniref:DUF2304 domain-containing protein n=1 Tax=Caldichromatium japonicum TaxID=2699430 RepID=A0A6G7VEX9_9GAMM|nr:DUF2304 domain-containing protein [Caldichromatium japonicum]QIK38599.1 DUF2304 domain-containing protein [Caldichromatium japonicum]